MPHSADIEIRHGPYAELTIPALLTGWLLGSLIAISIGYAALILGFSIEGSELAAILGFGILRGLLGRRSIIENNIAQTAASSVNAASSGMMFSVPALFILRETGFNVWLLTFGCIAGAFLGIAFIIPLRKQMIDFERLTFPGGVAVATILKSPGAGVRKAVLLLAGAVVSGGLHLIAQFTGLDNFDLGSRIGMPEYMNGVWYVSLLTVGVAYIAGRGGVAFIIGGFVCYWVIAPLLAASGHLPVDAATGALVLEPGRLMREVFRPTGIGMLIGGALMGIVLTLPLLLSAVRSMQSAVKSGAQLAEDEMPVHVLYVGIVLAAVVLVIIAINSVPGVGLIRGLAMGLLGTVWILVSGVILSESIGRTNWSPLSGMTLIAVTLLIMIVAELGDSKAIIAAVTVGAAACVAMSQATDLMLDLKTGYLVGAIPRRQQIAQFAGAWLGPIVVISVIFVLHEAYGLGSDRLPAPQGQALASMISGILGGNVPVEQYIAGAALGGMLSAAAGGLGILVGLGFYLPFNIVLTYSLGTLARVISDRRLGRRWADDVGIPLAAGFIVGEALVGVGLALYYIASAP